MRTLGHLDERTLLNVVAEVADWSSGYVFTRVTQRDAFSSTGEQRTEKGDQLASSIKII